MTKHSEASLVHAPYNWTYDDATEREAATGFVPADVGKLARQLDDNSLWMLIDDSPETWIAVGGGGGGGGGLVLLEQHTASASALLAFTTGITGTYDDYLLEIVDLVVASNNVDLQIQYSADGGSSYVTSSDYYSAGSYIQNGASLGTQGANPGAAFILGAGLANTSSRPFQGSIHLRSFASTALSKIIYGMFAYTNQSFVVGGHLQGLLLIPGTAYNAFKIFASSGNLTSGTARLYGVEK